MNTYHVFIALVLAYITLFILFYVDEKRNDRSVSRESQELNKKYSEARNAIGYKRAYFQFNTLLGTSTKGEHGGMAFSGVATDTYYSFESDAQNARHPFHSFYELATALKHQQKGNVFLEVVNSGDVNFHQLGMHASHQRVLQIMLRDCSFCEGPNGITSWKPMPGWNKWTGHDEIMFLCSSCTDVWKGEPLSELEKMISEKAGYTIPINSVTSIDDVGSFIPTPRD